MKNKNNWKMNVNMPKNAKIQMKWRNDWSDGETIINGMIDCCDFLSNIPIFYLNIFYN